MENFKNKNKTDFRSDVNTNKLATYQAYKILENDYKVTKAQKNNTKG